MSLWTIRCYLSTSGRDKIEDWFTSQTPTVQAEFLVRLEYLMEHPRQDWRRPHFDILKRECKGLGEIRFKADRLQHRMLGFFGPNRMEFTLVFPAIEKDRKFVPKSACNIGLRRKTEVLKDGSRAKRCEF